MGDRAGDLLTCEHWCNSLRQIVVYIAADNTDIRAPIALSGGSNDGLFVYISDVGDPSSIDGSANEGDILLQVNDVKVGGFTVKDAERLLADQSLLVSPYVHLAIVPCG